MALVGFGIFKEKSLLPCSHGTQMECQDILSPHIEILIISTVFFCLCVDEDYISTTNSIIFFNAGDRSREFTLTTVEDEIAEPTETFQVRLSNPNGLELGEDLAIVEIADNDGKE